MAFIMLAFMLGMYKNRTLNIAIFAGSIIVFAGALWLVRSQVTVQDRGTCGTTIHSMDGQGPPAAAACATLAMSSANGPTGPGCPVSLCPELLDADLPPARPSFITRVYGSVLAAKLGYGHAVLQLPQNTHDPGVSETRLLHRNLLVHPAEKILLPHPLKIRGVSVKQVGATDPLAREKDLTACE